MTARTPTALRIVRGNPGKRALPKNEANPAPAKSLLPPAWLPIEAKRAWRRLARSLADAGLLSSIDLPALVCLADAVGDLERISTQLQADGTGTTITTKDGNVVQHPLIGAKRRARLDVLKLAAAFGMTPVARAGLEVHPPSALAPAKRKSAAKGGEADLHERFFS